MDAATASLPLSRCLSEIAANEVPWAGDSNASFDTGSYAVLDHVDEGASALLYFRPADHQFLLYVYTPTHNDAMAADVADAVTRYLCRADAVYGHPLVKDSAPGEVLWELDRDEARRRLEQIRHVLARPNEDVRPYAFH
jgi:hypothetical protein